MSRRSLIFILPVIGFIGLAVIFSVAMFGELSGSRKKDTLPSVLVGRDAPALPPSALDAEFAAGFEDFAGRPVLVNFMASWCAPCRAEIPALEKLAEDIVVIAIVYKDKESDLRQFLSQYGNPYDAIWMDFDGKTGRQWGIYGVPESFLIDKDGVVMLRHAGPIFGDVIQEVITPALEKM